MALQYSQLRSRVKDQEMRETDFSDDDGSVGSESTEDHSVWRMFKCTSLPRPEVMPTREPTTCMCGIPFTGDGACSRCGASRPIAAKSRVEQMQLELEACQRQQAALEHKLADSRAAWLSREKQIQAELQIKASESEQLLEMVRREVHPPREKLQLPGPRSLDFVESDAFNMFISVVIVVNMITIFEEAAHPEYRNTCWWLDNIFLLVYVFEFLTKSLLWQKHLLLGPCNVVSWHYLDLFIVVGGALHMWIIPTAIQESASIIVPLRLLRLVRVAKLLHSFVVVDSSWAGKEPFQIFVMVLIALSSFVMGLEADYDGVTDFLENIYWEQVLLVIFSFELAVRLKNDRLRFFYDPQEWAWNWLDFVVVLGGVIDQCLLPAVDLIHTMIVGKSAPQNSNVGEFMLMLRMARLLRVLRLVRLVRQVPQLFNLLSGIAQAMAGMVWVLILTIVVLYFFSLLSVKLFRDGLVYGKEGAPPDVQELFFSVPESIFVLFTVMDGHKSILDPLLNSLPSTKVVFMIFVAISEWAMLSILTAVVSENMITVTEARKREKEVEEETDKDVDRMVTLSNIFTQIDADKDGTVDLQEFDAMLHDEGLRTRLCQAAGLSVFDLRLMFNILERNGRVHRQQFVEACQFESKQVSERSVMKLDKRLAEVEQRISTTLVVVEGAGIECCNGTYVEAGVHNLKPLYRKCPGDTGTDPVIYFDFVWKMNDRNDTAQWKYKRVSASYDYSAGDKWRAANESCGNAPIVRWENQHILDNRICTLDSRIQRLEGIVLQTHQELRKLTGGHSRPNFAPPYSPQVAG